MWQEAIMSKVKYRELINQVAKEFGQGVQESTDDACYFDVNGVFFTLKHGGAMDEDGLCIYADGGELPAANGMLILQRLMELNFLMFGRKTPRFGFNSSTKRVLATQRLTLSETSSNALTGELGGIAAQVQMWRQNFFLTTEEIAGAKS
jgi:hypothetical protein